MASRLRLMCARVNHRSLALVIVAYAVFVGAAQVLHVNPVYALLVAFFIDVCVSSERATEHTLVALAALLGLVPVLGWIHGADVLHPLEMLAACWIAVAFTSSNSVRKFSPDPAVFPALASGAIAFSWWRTISLGTAGDVLARLFPRWDNASHFNFYYSNLVDRQYLAVTKRLPGTLVMDGREYPSGVHYLWSLFSSSRRGLYMSNPGMAVQAFSWSVTVTLAAAAGIAALVVGRMGRSRTQRLLFGIVGAGLATGLISFGPLSQSISDGFSNIPAVVIGLLFVLSVGVRPLPSRAMQWTVVLSGVFCVLYNWYPLVILVAPVIWREMASLLRERKWRFLSVVSMAGIVGGLPPVIQTLSLGISHLSVSGGISPFPKAVGVSISLGSAGWGLILVSARGRRHVGALLTLPALMLMTLGVYLRITTDEYPYYFQKAFLLISVVTGILLLMVAADGFRGDMFMLRPAGLGNTIALFLGVIVLAFGMANVSGYIGPDRPHFAPEASAVGRTYRDGADNSKWEYRPTIDVLLQAASQLHGRPLTEKSCYSLFIPNRLGARGDVAAVGWKDLLANLWFHGLSHSYTRQAQSNTYAIPVASETLRDEPGLPSVISSNFDPASLCPVSTASVVSALRMSNPAWRTLTLKES